MRGGKDLIAGGILLIFAVITYFYIMPGEIESPFLPMSVSPFLFPLIALLGIGLGSFGLIFLGVKSLMGSTGLERIRSTDMKDQESRQKIIVLVLLNAVYPYLVDYLGFLPVTFVILALELWLLGVRVVLKVVVISLTVTGSLFVIFSQLLKVQLPSGLFDFWVW